MKVVRHLILIFAILGMLISVAAYACPGASRVRSNTCWEHQDKYRRARVTIAADNISDLKTILKKQNLEEYIPVLETLKHNMIKARVDTVYYLVSDKRALHSEKECQVFSPNSPSPGDDVSIALLDNPPCYNAEKQISMAVGTFLDIYQSAERNIPQLGREKAFAVALNNSVPANAIRILAIYSADHSDDSSDNDMAKWQLNNLPKYVVKNGDTLWGLSNKYLGNGSAYKLLMSSNPEIETKEGKIVEGQTILLPTAPTNWISLEREEPLNLKRLSKEQYGSKVYAPIVNNYCTQEDGKKYTCSLPQFNNAKQVVLFNDMTKEAIILSADRP